MFSRKQLDIIDKSKKLQTKFAEALINTKGKDKDIKDKIINSGYALCDNSDELLEIIEHLKQEVITAKTHANTAVTLMQTKGRQLKKFERQNFEKRTY